MNRAAWWQPLELAAVSRPAALSDIVLEDLVLAAPRNTKNAEAAPWRDAALLSDFEAA